MTQADQRVCVCLLLAHEQKYFGTAVGKGRQGAKTEIEKLKLMEKDLATAVNEVTKMCVGWWCVG